LEIVISLQLCTLGNYCPTSALSRAVDFLRYVIEFRPVLSVFFLSALQNVYSVTVLGT